MTKTLENLDNMESTPPQTEDAEERGFVEGVEEEERGQAAALDPDEVGDIADEGTAHRG